MTRGLAHHAGAAGRGVVGGAAARLATRRHLGRVLASLGAGAAPRAPYLAATRVTKIK